MKSKKVTPQAEEPKRRHIIIVKPDTISAEDKAALRLEGVVVISHPNPEEVKSLIGGMADGEDITMAALKAIAQSGGPYLKADFAAELCKRIYKPQKPQ